MEKNSLISNQNSEHHEELLDLGPLSSVAQTVLSRSSCKSHEAVLWSKFSNMFHETDGQLAVDLHRMHYVESVLL